MSQEVVERKKSRKVENNVPGLIEGLPVLEVNVVGDWSQNRPEQRKTKEGDFLEGRDAPNTSVPIKNSGALDKRHTEGGRPDSHEAGSTKKSVIEMMDGSDGLVYWQIGKAWGYTGAEVSYCPKLWGKEGLLLKADLVSVHMEGNGGSIPCLHRVEVSMNFYNHGEILVGAIKRFMEWAGSDNEEVLKWLDENKEMLAKVFEELAWSHKKAVYKIMNEIKEREEKKQWWFSVRKRKVEEFYEREVTSARNMKNSAYLNDSISSRGTKELAEEIRKNGRLVDKVVIRNEYNTEHIVEVYEYKGKRYGVEEKFFSNDWGMDIERITVWEILE